MKIIEVNNLQDILSYIDKFSRLNSSNTNLFRGQSKNYDLLPAICRNNNTVDTTETEYKMLNELRRRIIRDKITSQLKNDWDWLIYAQHYGLKTRLLDWSTNPLVALWFSLIKDTTDSYFYILSVNNDKIIDDLKNSPLENDGTKIIKPNFNNKRIISQSGWFTIHSYSEKINKFIPLDKEKGFEKNLLALKISRKYNNNILSNLDTLGINAEFIFQDNTGSCSYINWKYKV